GGCRPPRDLPVQPGTAPYLDAQTAVVVLARVRAHCPGVMPLEGRAPELLGIRPADAQPELLGSADIGAFMDLDLVDQPVAGDSVGLEAPEDKLSKPWVSFCESPPVVPPIRLVLGSFAPVGDRPGDDDLSIVQLADLIRGGSASCDASCLADLALGSPPSPDA